jgi:hypothetical protein
MTNENVVGRPPFWRLGAASFLGDGQKGRNKRLGLRLARRLGKRFSKSLSLRLDKRLGRI